MSEASSPTLSATTPMERAPSFSVMSGSGRTTICAGIRSSAIRLKMARVRLHIIAGRERVALARPCITATSFSTERVRQITWRITARRLLAILIQILRRDNFVAQMCCTSSCTMGKLSRHSEFDIDLLNVNCY